VDTYNTDGIHVEAESEALCIRDEAGSPDMLRREFMKRFGVYAAGSAIGLYVLMSPGTSAIAGSDGGPLDSASQQQPESQKMFQYREYK